MMGSTRLRLERLRSSGDLGTGRFAETAVQRVAQDFLFPGQERIAETEAGPCYWRHLRFPLKHRHGSGRLSEVLSVRGAELVMPVQDENLADIRPEGLLFVDIETTGLSGGTGTWIILLGLAWLEEDTICLRQYFLRHPAEEKAMLRHFSKLAEGFSDIVSFNGRSFDLPIIGSRLILNGILTREPKCHIDLLLCARRLWKYRLTSCSLRSLESEILGLQRREDIPGAEIPAAYFHYLRRGETKRLPDIFEHNVLDILSMVRLLAVVARAAGGETIHPADNYSLGNLFHSHGRTGEAVSFYSKAACCGDEKTEHAALWRLSRIYKRQGTQAEAAALWHELIRRFPYDADSYIELAKYYEHKAGDCDRALDMTEKALRCMHQSRLGTDSAENGFSAVSRRMARLKRKIRFAGGDI